MELIHKIPSNFHCLTDNTHTNMLTISKISSLPSSFLLCPRESEKEGVIIFTLSSTSLVYTLARPQFPSSYRGRRRRRRIPSSLPRATFIIPLLSIVYFQTFHFQNVPLPNLPLPPFLTFLEYIYHPIFSTVNYFVFNFSTVLIPSTPFATDHSLCFLQIIVYFTSFYDLTLLHYNKDRSCNYLS